MSRDIYEKYQGTKDGEISSGEGEKTFQRNRLLTQDLLGKEIAPTMVGLRGSREQLGNAL